MKRIVIFAGGDGKAAERVVKLFNDGNRVHTDLVFTSISDAAFAETLAAHGATTVFFNETVWQNDREEILRMLRDNAPDLIVTEEWPVLPDEICAVAPQLVVTSAQEAPLQIVRTLENEWTRQPDDMPEPPEPDMPKSVDHEWADELQINFKPPKMSEMPEIPVENIDLGDNQGFSEMPQPPADGREQQAERQASRGNGANYYGNREYQRAPYPRGHENRREEPMPPTYLIWAVLATVFCCFIPGIVAIIFASQVSTRYFSGDIEGARRASRTAEIWIIVSFVLGVLTATLWIPWMIIN